MGFFLLLVIIHFSTYLFNNLFHGITIVENIMPCVKKCSILTKADICIACIESRNDFYRKCFTKTYILWILCVYFQYMNYKADNFENIICIMHCLCFIFFVSSNIYFASSVWPEEEGRAGWRSCSSRPHGCWEDWEKEKDSRRNGSWSSRGRGGWRWFYK